MAYKQNPGRGPMMKTGRNIPKSMCSPVMQVKDAISGRKIPEGATFGETKKSTDDFGATVYSTDYSKKGAKGGPSGVDLGPDFKPTKEQTRKANERIIKQKKSTKSISGTVQNKIYSGKTAGIKPVESTSKPSGEIVQKTFKTKSKEEIQKDKDYIDRRNKTNKKNARRMKRAKFWGNIGSALTPSGKSGFKPGCF
jgi:hypothetical protein